MPPRISANCTLICPKRTAGGVSAGGVQRPVGRVPVGKQPLAALADGFHRRDEAGEPAFQRWAISVHSRSCWALLAARACWRVSAKRPTRPGSGSPSRGAGEDTWRRSAEGLFARRPDRGQPRRIRGLDLGRLALPPREARAHRGEKLLVGPADLGPWRESMASNSRWQSALAVSSVEMRSRPASSSVRRKARYLGALPPCQDIDRHADGNEEEEAGRGAGHDPVLDVAPAQDKARPAGSSRPTTTGRCPSAGALETAAA